MSDASSCVFCAIVAGRLPCHEVLDDGKVKVLMDAFPACDGHVLVIPHAHVENIFELDEQTVRDVAAMVRRVAIALKTTLAPDGLTISQANGSAAGQTVPHYHVHLMPRTAGVKLRSHGSGAADPARLTELAGAIRANMPSA